MTGLPGYSQAKELFDGVMLSDGSIIEQKNGRSPVFGMVQGGTEHMDWLASIRDSMGVLGVDTAEPAVRCRSASLPRDSGRVAYSNSYQYSSLRSRASLFITAQRGRWYHPDSRLKRVPEDIVLSPVCLANFFMGDGSTARCKNCMTTVQTCFYTQGFDYRSIETIEEKLRTIGIHTGRAHDRDCSPPHSGIVITILQNSVDDLMNIVEPYIVPSFTYKIKRKRE